MNVRDVLSDSVRRSAAPASRAAPGRLDVDVEQDLGVVADEPDGDDEEGAGALRGAAGDELAQVRADPGLRRSSRALIRDVVLRDAGLFGHAACGGGDFAGVDVAAVDDTLRQAVRREDDRLVGARLGLAHALGEGLQQQRMRVEAAHGVERHARRQRRLGRIHVLLHAEC